MHQDKFSFQRSRGIVWVCDLADSSKHLNDDATAAELEEFLPRLHWLGMVVVEAAGGTFLKWTGDGFLAWFETPLHREVGEMAKSLFDAIWHLTFTVNVTQLGTSADKKFHLRHGVSYEHDALLTTITHVTGHKSLDVTGRGVVLAFRLSGIRSEFPNVVTDAQVARAASDAGFRYIHFKRWVPNPYDLNRYFKGERWGTRNLAVSVEKKPRVNRIQTIVKKNKKLISRVETANSPPFPSQDFVVRYQQAVSNGPQWAKDVHSEEIRFIREDMLGSLKQVTRLLEETSKSD